MESMHSGLHTSMQAWMRFLQNVFPSLTQIYSQSANQRGCAPLINRLYGCCICRQSCASMASHLLAPISCLLGHISIPLFPTSPHLQHTSGQRRRSALISPAKGLRLRIDWSYICATHGAHMALLWGCMLPKHEHGLPSFLI